MALSAPRLPGLRFETARPPAVPGLPRMDVAAFAGFASAGPVGVPVAVDDEVRFRAVFGPDLPLAWDAARGETVYAHLAPAVREFFRNGGRRCWIVRVGDESAMEAASFRVPGLLHGRGRTLGAGFLLASSPGSWADGMSLNATLQSDVVSGVAAEGDGVRLPVDSTDLLKLEWPDSGTVAFFPPRRAAPEADLSADDRRAEKIRPFAHAYWFRRAEWAELTAVGLAPAFLAGPREVPLEPVGWQVVPGATEDETYLEVRLAADAAPGLQAGCWIRVVLAYAAGLAQDAGGGVTGFMAIDPPSGGPGVPSLWGPQPQDAAPSILLQEGQLAGFPSGGEEGGGGDGGSGGGGDENGGDGGYGGEEPAGSPPPSEGGGGGGEGDEGGYGGEESLLVGSPPLGAAEESGEASEPALLGKRAYLRVDEVLREQNETVVILRQAWRTMHRRKAPQTVAFSDALASLVRVELWTRRGDGSVVRLPDVGLAPAHARYLGGLPPDQVLFAPTETLAQSATDPASAQPSIDRMQLAAPDPRAYVVTPAGAVRPVTRADALALSATEGDESGGGTDDDEGGTGDFEAYLPLGVTTVPRDDFFQAAYTSGRTALERDGLGELSAGLFLDEELASQDARTLLDTAFYNTYVAEPPLPPIRMHALLPVDEVSLLAVPDAVHPGWELRDVDAPPPAPEPPHIHLPVAQPDAEGHLAVHWSQVQDALQYTLEDSPDPRFRTGVRATQTVPRTGDAGTHASLVRPRPCPDRLYFRVRVRTLAGLSAWSSTALLDLPGDAFRGCGVVPLAAPVVTSFIPAGERLSVFWSAAAEDPALAAARAGYDRFFRVETSPEPTFGLAELLYEGTETRAELWTPQSGALFFRAASWLAEKPRHDGDACACIVEESPWSATLGFGTDPPRRWETLAPRRAADAARPVHEAMLRFCAARSDCFAVLALPRHHREADALAHAEALADALGGIAEPGDAGARTLSFGALYHPWTVVRTTVAEAPLRAIPPDGATAGVMAARANEPGAWAAPANRPLDGVAALDPKLPETVRAAFLGRKVNAVAPFPRGFMTWSEETLSDDPELRGIGVRRLLILLRRLALREGDTYVFQPNDAAFRRLVHRQFDALLGDLYGRGAFAGATHAQGYRVVVDDTVNPREGVDQGRLVVELRVAPSRPLAFLTVRLVQTGAGVTVQEA